MRYWGCARVEPLHASASGGVGPARRRICACTEPDIKFCKRAIFAYPGIHVCGLARVLSQKVRGASAVSARVLPRACASTVLGLVRVLTRVSVVLSPCACPAEARESGVGSALRRVCPCAEPDKRDRGGPAGATENSRFR